MQVTLKSLSTGYGHKVVASYMNATLHSGGLTCLLGPNGAGKSTLLHTLCAFQPPLDGDVMIANRRVQEYSSGELSRLIGVVLTERIQVQGLTVEALAAMGRSPYTGFFGGLKDEDKAAVAEALKQVGITHLANRQVHTLSDGERQMVMIAKALAQQTPIILLDEPTAFLDFPSKVEMMRMLRRLAHQMDKTIFLSTHDVELALQLSDYLWLLMDGKLHANSRDELIQSGLLEQFINCPGVTFDPESGIFRVEPETN